jgi:hypothetical protein
MSRAEAQGRRVGKMVVVLWSLRLRVSAREGFSCGRRPHWALRASMVTICAERTQFPTGSGGPRSRRRGAIMQNEPNSGSKRAKRTQFRTPETARTARNALRRHYKRRRLCKTNPISVRRAECRAGTPNLRRGETCKTNPIWPRPGSKRAKRSQTWGD